MNYTIQYTDINTIPIIINEGSSDSSSTDITLFGRTDLEYGAPLDSDMLHILERFSCPAITGSTIANASPDLSKVSDTIALHSPTDGELWYNSTHKRPYIYDGKWVSISTKNDYGANWGVIFDGNKIPLPASQTSGHVFSYSECIMSVSPSNVAGNTNYMICTVDPTTGMVTMKYQLVGGSGFISTQANYLIVGMRENVNFPPPTLTPPLPPGVTPSPTVTPTVTPSITVTPTITPTLTPGASVTPTPTPTPTPIAGTTPTPTISVTPSQAVIISSTPFPTTTPSPTATITPTVTPSKTPVQPLVASVNTTSIIQTVNVPYTSQQLVTGGGVTVTPSGGISPYTYMWNFVSGQTTTLINGTTTTPSFSAVVPCGNLAIDSTWKCTVTDSAGVISYTPLISVSLRNISVCPGI